MDGIRFDAISRALGLMGRRGVCQRIAATVALAIVPLRVARAGKRKKLKRNAFGCVPLGKPCRGKNQVCCSGVCKGDKPRKGKKDRSRCVAHGEGSCQAGQNLTGCGGETVQCMTITGDVGSCRTTTGNAAYCAADGQCRECRNDADCRPFCGPDAACVVCGAMSCKFGTQCVGPSDDGCTFPA